MATKAKKKFTKREAPEFPSIGEMLEDLLTIPGKIDPRMLWAYDYSPGNAFSLAFQCAAKGFETPICAASGRWFAIGRKVKKGTKKLWVLHPRSFDVAREDENGDIVEKHMTTFVWKPTAVCYDQTEGPEVELDFRDWDIGKALVELEVEAIPFKMTSGNCHGYAYDRHYAVSPVASHPAATTFHELAHIMLGHTENTSLEDSDDRTPRDVKEFEAEAVAHLVLSYLDIHDHEEASRAYVQHWYKSNEVEEKTAKHINKVAHQILKAGR